MRKFLFLLIIFSAILYSCTTETEEEGNFWAHNYSTSQRYKLQADLLAEGEYCNVWVESGSDKTADFARKIADEFDNEILPIMLETFSNSANYADFIGDFGDGDSKLCILLLNIRGGSYGSTFVAGYFWPYDLFQRTSSNQRDMLYINININQEDTLYTTIAHEFQHLMNYVIGINERSDKDEYGQITNINVMDTWIDEGLSEAAEWVYSGSHNFNRVGWYMANGGTRYNSLIDKGNNFYVWGNRTNEENGDNAVVDDYATVYLFFQWLRLQQSSYNANSNPNVTTIYKDIITSPYTDYRAVTRAAASRISNSSYGNDNWANLLRDWLAANYVNSTSGRYGYRNDPMLKSIEAHLLLQTRPLTYQLFPGEGLFSYVAASRTTPANSGNIRYTGLNSNNTSNPFISSLNAGNALLSYNVNTNIHGSREEATVTGASPLEPVSGIKFDYNSGSNPISGNDMLRSRGFGNGPLLK